MFLGHYGVALGAKTAARGVSLGSLFLAAQFLDLLWPTLLLAGVEHVEIRPGVTAANPLDFTSYPISHSLLMAVVWAAAVGGLYGLIRKRPRGAVVMGLLVVSHWVLDLVVHRPDLPLYPGAAPHVGLGLWHSVPATLLAEALVFGVGLSLYLRATEATSRKGVYGFWALVAVLVLIQAANTFGPPPTDVAGVAWGAQLLWISVLWGYWVDRHRAPRKRAGVSVSA